MLYLFLGIPSCIRDAKNIKRKQRLFTRTAVHRNGKICDYGLASARKKEFVHVVEPELDFFLAEPELNFPFFFLLLTALTKAFDVREETIFETRVGAGQI